MNYKELNIIIIQNKNMYFILITYKHIIHVNKKLLLTFIKKYFYTIKFLFDFLKRLILKPV